MNYIAKKIALQEKNILNHADLYLDYNNRIAFHKNRKINLTVKEFVTFMAELKKVPRKEKKERVSKVLYETGIEDVANKLIRNLSRGYKQRVSLAGALVSDPKVIILDEPTVGLDPKQITEIL